MDGWISAMEIGEKEMEEHGCFIYCRRSLHSSKVFHSSHPYLLMILVSICNAGLNFASKVSLDKGMSPFVLVAYGNAVGAIVTAAFLLVFERKSRPKMNLPIFMEVFLLGVLGFVVSGVLYFAGLERTSSTFASVMSNLFPSMTFLLAFLLRMEKLDIRKIRSQAKVAGTLVAFGGAALMTLYKGITLISMAPPKNSHHPTQPTASSGNKDWINGSVMLVFCSLTRAAFTILQAKTIKKYAAPISLTSLTSFVAIFPSIVATFAIERKASVWRLGWDLRLLSVGYSGVIIIGVTTYLQLLVIRQKGPVFVAVFNPLSTVIVSLVDLFVLRQSLHIGSAVGAVLIILGLYMVLWGKYKENQKKTLKDEEQSGQGIASDHPPNTNQDPNCNQDTRQCG